MTQTAPPQMVLPDQLKFQLWRRIDRRLQRGEVLITTEHFQKVMEREFKKMLQVPPSKQVKELLRKMIVAVNEAHPQTFLTLGIKNAVTRYFNEAQNRMQGQSLESQHQALQMISEMIKGGRTSFFLESIGVEVGEKGVSPRIEEAIRKIVDGQRLLPAFQEEEHKASRRRGAEMVPVHTLGQEQPEEPPEEKAAQAPSPTAEDEQVREQQEQKSEEDIAAKEMLKATQNLDSYVKQKLITEEEAIGIRDLYKINEQLKKGEIDPEEAERIRNSMDENVRRNLDEKLRQAVDYSVLYLNVFNALKRIPDKRDDVLRFLIRNKQLAITNDPEVDLSALIRPLEEDDELLDSAVQLIERKDQEIRMIAANMPPYRRIAGDNESIGNLVVEESFIDDLRTLDDDALSERLNSEEVEVRVRAAGDMRCLLALISHATRETIFHREVRRLKIMQTIKRIYGEGVDGKKGRHNVQHFLKRRMPKLYPTMDAGERAAIEGESAQVVDALEGGGGEEEESRDNSKRIYRV